MFFPIPLEFKKVEARAFFPLANAVLVLVNVLIYLLGWSWPVGPGTGPASILMYGFCHFGFWHLVMNMWVLWVFGNPVNRRLGNGLYLLVYLGCLAAVGLIARFFVPVGLVGASGGIFAVMTIALILMPSAIVESAYVAMFPLTILFGLWKRPQYELNWFLSWGILVVPAWWCLLLIPLMELFSIVWRWWCYGWVSSWTPAAHLLGILCGVAAVLILPSRITERSSWAGI